MFGSSNNKKDKLQEKYKELMEESYRLSHIDRKKSDLKRGEAEEVGKLLDELETQGEG
ncbi:MAG: Lacal_2735 family protein [Rhodothermales bacterium]|nr:Lacal_2735 family protein [Rhodothermales bacterium]